MRPTRLSLMLAIGGLLFAQGAARAEAPVVVTSGGAVRGVVTGEGAVFRGIPYAASTAGAARWRPPVPTRWKGVRAATGFGAICPQPTVPGPERAGPQSEDCLSLNIATPKTGAATRRPVLVLVHGGAFFVGSGADDFDTSARVYNAKGIVVVAMNYRLGRLGFFAHPGLRAEQPGAPVGNYWLMDQVAALRWIRRNIAAFGGDPQQMTILGCSAGGSSINSLMASPEARGLFQRASAHSGGGITNASRPLARAEDEGIAFAGRAGVSGTGAGAIARLRALTPAQVMAADPGAPDFGAIVDGRYLRDDIGVSFARGDIARVPYLVGSTSNEASIFGLMGFDAGVMKARFGIDPDTLRPAYGAGLPAPELLRQVQTDFIFTAGATLLGGLAARRAPAWTYHFAYVPPQDVGAPGAAHCADMAYALGSPRIGADPANARIAAMMQGYVADFVKTGDPNGPGLPDWPQFRGAGRPLLLIDRETRAVADFR